MPATSSFELRLCFAGPHALVPRMAEFGVTATAAVSEPRTSAAAATASRGFIDGAAFEAHGPGGCRRGLDNYC